jgi:serine/threonine-protein kinase
MSITDRLGEALGDRYRIERELGAGGMATVYLAADLKHDRKVAIKVLKPELAAVLGAERFVQEIKTTAALSHPHILPLFDSGEAGGFLYYVMPYIQGETIREKLNRETQFGIDEAVRITTEVADALDYAHRNGVIHRDIKPENILLHDGRPMVMDFGIALAVSAAAGGRMTETGLSLGTPHYMSPEQATADKAITARSDVYSLASVLYEMLAGEPPHTGGSAQAIIMKIIAERAQPVTELRGSVPPNVAAALGKALEKLPADRFASARTFSEALSNPGFATSVGPGVAGVAQHPVRSRLPWIVAAASLLSTAVLVAIVMQMAAGDESRPPWLVDLDLPENAGFGAGLALSPDGGTLVYGGRGQIWLRRAASTTPLPIAGSEGGCCPALSPDGQQVAFVRGADVHVVPVGGGEARRLGAGFGGGDDIAWTDDGYIVGLADGGGGLGSAGLLRVSAAGGPVQSFTRLDTLAGESAHWSPRALPGARGVLFTVVPLDQGDSVGLRIAVVGPDGGAHTVLMPGRVAAFAPPGHLIVTLRDGSVVAVPFDLKALRIIGDPIPLFTVPNAPATFTWRGYTAVSSTGRLVYVGGEDAPREFVWLDRAGSPTVAGLDARSAFGRIAIAAGDAALAFDAFLNGERRVIEVRDLRSGASSRVEIAGGSVMDVGFAPDGRSVVFRAVAPGQRGIFNAELGRLAEHKRLLDDPNAGAPSLSPDNRTLYFVRGGDRVEFVARALGQPEAPEHALVTGGRETYWEPQVSPNGRWLAFVESGASGRQLFVRSTDPGRAERWSVAQTSATSIQWSSSGRELFFIANGNMMVAEVSADSAFTVARQRPLHALRPEFGMQGFRVAANGRFLVTRVVSGGSANRVFLLDDWRRLLPPQ